MMFARSTARRTRLATAMETPVASREPYPRLGPVLLGKVAASIRGIKPIACRVALTRCRAMRAAGVSPMKNWTKNGSRLLDKK